MKQGTLLFWIIVGIAMMIFGSVTIDMSLDDSAFATGITVLVIGLVLIVGGTALVFVRWFRKQQQNNNPILRYFENHDLNEMLSKQRQLIRDYLDKFGVHVDYAVADTIIAQFDGSTSDEDRMGIILAHIPVTTPSLAVFQNELVENVKRLIKKIPSQPLQSIATGDTLKMIMEINEDAVSMIINIQRETSSDEKPQYFRFNYDLAACGLVITAIEDYANANPTSPLRTDAAIALGKLLEYGKENGYDVAQK